MQEEVLWGGRGLAPAATKAGAFSPETPSKQNPEKPGQAPWQPCIAVPLTSPSQLAPWE